MEGVLNSALCAFTLENASLQISFLCYLQAYFYTQPLEYCPSWMCDQLIDYVAGSLHKGFLLKSPNTLNLAPSLTHHDIVCCQTPAYIIRLHGDEASWHSYVAYVYLLEPVV